MNLTIEVEIISPTLIGSGEGGSSFIDSDIVYDDYGIPLFPGRRLKGLLRESAEEAACMLDLSLHNNSYYQRIDSLFGLANQPSRLRVGNLQVQEVEQAHRWLEWFFQEYSFSKEIVLNALCSTRIQTKIDKNGVAEAGSLRKIRLLNKGLIFEGQLLVEDSDERDLILMGCTCLALKTCGSKRNRGLGGIRCSLKLGARNLCQEAMAAIEKERV